MFVVCCFVLGVVGHQKSIQGQALAKNHEFFRITAAGAGTVQRDALPDETISLLTWSHLVPSSLIEVAIMVIVTLSGFCCKQQVDSPFLNYFCKKVII